MRSIIFSLVYATLAFAIALPLENESNPDDDSDDRLGYVRATRLMNSIIAPPVDCNGKNSLIGLQNVKKAGDDNENNEEVNLKLCRNACNTTSGCHFYNAYILFRNGKRQGQFCALYTQRWNQSYATNSSYTNGSNKYTFKNSYISYNSADQGYPVCPSDLVYLNANGSEFCTSYIHYIAPVTTTTTTTTPPMSTLSQVFSTSTTSTETVTVTTTMVVALQKRDIATSADNYRIAVETILNPYPDKGIPNATPAAKMKRGIPTPTLVTSWLPYKISAACSQVATGTLTSTSVSVEPTPLTTVYTSTFTSTLHTTVTTTTTSIILPDRAILLASPTPIFGDIVHGAPYSSDDVSFRLSLPFPIGVYGQYSSSVYLCINGFVNFDGQCGFVPGNLPTTVISRTIMFFLWDDLYIYRGTMQGIYYEIVGPVGSRILKFEWFCSAYSRSDQHFHFVATFFENNPGYYEVRYFDVSTDISVWTRDSLLSVVGAQADAGLPSARYIQWTENGGHITNGLQINIDTNTNTISRSSF